MIETLEQWEVFERRMDMLDNDPETERSANQKRIDEAEARRARGRARSQSVQAHNPGRAAKPVFILPEDPAGVYVDASFDEGSKLGFVVAVQIDSDKNLLDIIRWGGEFATSSEAEVNAIRLGVFLVKQKGLKQQVYTDYEGGVDAYRGQVVWLPRTYMGVAHSRAYRGMSQLLKQRRNAERNRR